MGAGSRFFHHAALPVQAQLKKLGFATELVESKGGGEES